MLCSQRLNVCAVILETMCFTQQWIISSLGRFSDASQVLKCFNRVSALMVDVYTPAYSGGPVSFKCDSIWPPMCLERHTKKIKALWAHVVAFEELCSSPSGPSLADTSLTSLHMSFHLLRFFLSHSPWSLLRARKLQLKLSQSGTQLRLSGDLRGKKARDWM